MLTSTEIFNTLREKDVRLIFVLASCEDMFEILIMAWRLLGNGGDLNHWITYEGSIDILLVAIVKQSWKVVEVYLGGGQFFESENVSRMQYQKSLGPIIDEWIVKSNFLHYIVCDDMRKFLHILMKYRPHLFKDNIQCLKLHQTFQLQGRYVKDLVRPAVCMAQFEVLDWVHRNMPSEFAVEMFGGYNLGHYISKCEDYGKYSEASRMVSWFWEHSPSHIWYLSPSTEGLLWCLGDGFLVNSVNVNAERLRFKSLSVLKGLAGDTFFDSNRYHIPPWFNMFSGIIILYTTDHVKFIERFGEIEEFPFIRLYEEAVKRSIDARETNVHGNTILHYMINMAVQTKIRFPLVDDHCIMQFLAARIMLYMELNNKDVMSLLDVKNDNSKTVLDVAEEYGLMFISGFMCEMRSFDSIYRFVIEQKVCSNEHTQHVRDIVCKFIEKMRVNIGVKKLNGWVPQMRVQRSLTDSLALIPNKPVLISPITLAETKCFVDIMLRASLKWEEYEKTCMLNELTDERIECIVRDIDDIDISRDNAKKKKGGKKKRKGGSKSRVGGVAEGMGAKVGNPIEESKSSDDSPDYVVVENEIDEVQVVEEKADGCCVVCFTAPRTHAYVPCGHWAVCEGCSEMYSKRCVICNQESVMRVKIFDQSL